MREDRIVSWLADVVSRRDTEKFGAVVGESKWNTMWGNLAILVSLRAWPWCGTATLEVRSDSAAALSSLVKLSS